MSGISGSGLISGIDTAGLINQLIAVASRPKVLAQTRLIQLQGQQAAFLDLNTQLSGLRSAAQSFRTDSVFRTKLATSSNAEVLTASASPGAQAGTYSFIVDRLVSSRQMLSRGFQDRNSTAVGAQSFTFESAQGRLDRDISLSALNDGAGIARGKIRVTAGADSAEVDLSRAATVSDVLDAINGSGLNVTARVRDGRFEIVGATSVTNAGSADTAGTLGLSVSAGGGVSGGAWVGSSVYSISGNTALSSLNDGNGVDYNARTVVTEGVATDVRLVIGGVTVDVGLGDIRARDDNGTPGDTSDDTFPVVEGAVSTIEGLLGRFNDAFTAAGVNATATIDTASGALRITTSGGATIDSITQVGAAKTVRDLGLNSVGSGATSVTGARIFSGMGTTLLSGLNGGGSNGGVGGDGLISFQTRNGGSFSIDLDSGSFDTVEGLIDFINGHASNNGAVTVELNAAGTGLRVRDNTGGGGLLIITGTDGSDSAASLGISTGAGGVSSNAFEGSSLQRRYIGEATRLESLRNGRGVGEGKIRLIDASGLTAEVTIGPNEKTVADLIAQIQSQISAQGLALSVGINDTGDGIKISDTSGSGNAIRVEDVTGSVASNLRLAKTASGVGASNTIDGSFETTVEFSPTDTLNDMVTKINNAGAGVRVSILNDGSGARPFRLSFTAVDSGVAGRFTLDTNGFDLGLSVLDEGEDARVFFGSTNPATAILLSNSSNTLDNVISGVSIDLVSVNSSPVTVSVTEDTAGIEKKVQDFIDAYNRIVATVARSTRFDSETGERGALLGDGLVLGLRSGLFRSTQAANRGFTGAFSRLGEVGVRVGSDGNLELNKERFREAMIENPQAVEALFTRRVIDTSGGSDADLPGGVTVRDPNARESYSELGVIGQIEEFARTYIDSIDGVLTARTQSLDTQIRNQRTRIDRLQDGLDRQRLVLEQRFTAMERALAQLQGQQSALSSISLIRR